MLSGRVPRRLVVVGWLFGLWVGWMLFQAPYTVMRALGDNLFTGTGMEPAERVLFLGYSPPRVLQDTLYARDLPWLDYASFLLHGFWFGIPFAFGAILMIYARPKLLDYLSWQIVLFHVSAVLFLFFPVRPPWMEDGISRVLLERNYGGYTDLDNNPMAAFPSLHAGLPALTFLYFYFEGGRKLRFFAWLALGFTLAVSFAIVYMGEHWVIDVLAGYGVAALVCLACRRQWPQRAAQRIPGDPVGRLARLNQSLLGRRHPPEPVPIAPNRESSEPAKAA